MKIIPFRYWAVLMILFLATQSSAWAHAFLYYSIPKVGSVLTNSPSQIKICFTEHLTEHGSTIEVRDARGKQVDKKDSHRGDQDQSLLFVSVPKLPAGTYTVNWQALSEDNHRTEGHFKFTIK